MLTSIVTCFKTASHLPYNRNGFKFFTNAGGLGKSDVKDILTRAANIYEKFADEDLKNAEKIAPLSVKKVDYMAVYTSNLVAAVRKASGNIGNYFMMLLNFKGVTDLHIHETFLLLNFLFNDNCICLPISLK